MLRWFHVALHLIVEAGATRLDALIRFLKAQLEILRRKLGGNRVIPSPDDRARLLAIGQERDHDVADMIGIVTPRRYSCWVTELREGHKPKCVGRTKIARNMRERVIRLATENDLEAFMPRSHRPAATARSSRVGTGIPVYGGGCNLVFASKT